MAWFDLLIAFAALWLLCAFLSLRCGLHSALAPLAALSLVALWFTVGGMLGVLRSAGYVFYALCLVLGAWTLLPITAPLPAQSRRPVPRLSSWITPGMVVFWGLSAFFALYFALRQPLFADFDEFSFWGTAAKLTSTNDALYTTAEIGWAWQATQNPGLITLSYFVQFFGAFAPWKTFLAYDMLLFACFAAVVGALPWKKYALALPLAAICWCVPWFFTTYNRTIYNAISTVYMSSYGDIPAGVLLGGTIAFWLWLRQSGGPLWTMLPVLAFCGNIKSNTFVLALVAAGLVLADEVLFGEKPFTKGLARRAGFGLLCMAAPLAQYMSWNRYIAGLVAQNAAGGGMGETSQDIVTVGVSGLKILLGLPVSEYYTARMDRFHGAAARMASMFWDFDAGKLSMIGPGVVLTALIGGLFGLALLLAHGNRLRVAAFGLLSAGGFVGYNFMLTLSYAFIFKEEQYADLVDYNRYLYTYYIGWFLLAMALLALILNRHSLGSAARLLGEGCVLLLAAAMLLRTHQLVLPQMSVLGFSGNYFADQRMEQARADAVNAVMEPGSRVFFVSQGDNGYRWFAYCYDFLPTVVDYSGNLTQGGGGGTFGAPGLRPAEEDYNRWLYYHAYTAEQFAETVRESGCDYLFVETVDDIFTQSYAALFSDGLSGAEQGTTLLYQVTEDAFEPVEMEVPQ